MRILLLFFVLIISRVVQADELLLPDQIVDTPASDTTNSYISSEATTSVAPTITAADAAALVEKKFSGQVMSVTLLDNAEHPVYGVKILKNGHMKTIYVDATTGLLSKLSE
jgi:uncharacterized membrane protein YkoI